MGHRRITDAALLFRLWHDETLRVEDIADRLRVTPNTVTRTAQRFGLANRSRVVSEIRERKAIEDAEDDSTVADLRLDAWTEERARPIRDAWSEDERYHRRVQKIQPICYGGVYP
jgi:DNA-binding MurR/RpiR family transcriptional regulator